MSAQGVCLKAMAGVESAKSRKFLQKALWREQAPPLLLLRLRGIGQRSLVSRFMKSRSFRDGRKRYGIGKSIIGMF